MRKMTTQNMYKNCECIEWARTELPILTRHHPNCPKYKKKIIKIWTITPKGCAPCTEKDTAALLAWLEDATTGEEMRIVVGEIDEAVYDELPEYVGP